MNARDDKGRFIRIQDPELMAINEFLKWTSTVGFDAQWRALNYVCIRVLGRVWKMPSPKGDA